MLPHQARQAIEKGCELFPETVEAQVRKLYADADASSEIYSPHQTNSPWRLVAAPTGAVP